MRVPLRLSLVASALTVLGLASHDLHAQSAPVAQPAQAQPTAGSTSRAAVKCTDGTTSPAGRGACARHGGIAANAKPSTVTPASGATATNAARSGENLSVGTPGPAAARAAAGRSANPSGQAGGAAADTSAAGATAQCKDGTYSHVKGRRGACSRHGGVAKFLTS